MFMIRQGDVLVKSCDAIPASATKVKDDKGRTILAYGELTGHAHALPYDEAILYADNDNNYLHVIAPSSFLTHEEHAPIEIPAGNYRVIHQREYHRGEIQRVLD